MAEVLLDAIVQTDYGQLTLEGGPEGWDGEADRFFAGQKNGWVGASGPDTVVVLLARRSGGSGVRIVRHDTAPDLRADAEDIVEVSFTLPPGADFGWYTWAAEDGGPLPLPPGSYRLRASATGRDAGADDEFAEGVVDHYVLDLWPAEPSADAVVRVGSDDARYWHREWGGSR